MSYDGNVFRIRWPRSAPPDSLRPVRHPQPHGAAGGIIAPAITEDRAYQSMGVELDRIWMGAMSWGLVRPENPQGNGAGGAWSAVPAHP